MKKLLFAVIMLALVSIVAIVLLAKSEGLFSTRKGQPAPLVSHEQKVPKRIIGFLPYWQMGAIDRQKLIVLDEAIYFGVTIDEEGSFVRNQGLTRLASVPFAQFKQVSLAIALQDNEKIEIFLKNKNAQEQLYKNIEQLLTQYPKLSGINFDFEYSGIPGKDTVAQYAAFVQSFRQNLKKSRPESILSVDITADAMKKSRLYDVEKLADAADYIVLMGYDFFRPTSSVAGPVAPLTGKELYEYDVTTAVFDFLTVVPKEKLILGVPYYGWDFPTVDDVRGSFIEKRTDESVALASYKRTRQLIDGKNVDLRYDEESQTPWLVYHDPDTNGIRQVWFEDEKSLAKKYDLVNKEGLAGIAIWALGYDGLHPELWKLLEEKFQP